MPAARTSVRAAPDGVMSRTEFPAVTASTSAAGLQPMSPRPGPIGCTPLPSPLASHTVDAGAAGTEGPERLAVNASHRPSGANTGLDGRISGRAARRSVL